MGLLDTDFSKPTCRVCLKNKQDKEMTSILDMDAGSENLRIYEKIECCAGIKILCDTKLPNFICGSCNKLLKSSYKFRTVCQNSEEFLKTIIEPEECQPKTEETDEIQPKEEEEETLETVEFQPKEEETLEQSYLPMNDKISNETVICEYERIDNSEHVIEEANNTSCSPSDNEEAIKALISENDSDVFIDIYYPEGEDILSGSENIEVTVEGMDLDTDKGILKPKKYKKKSNVKKKKLKSTGLKTLEVSSDGTAVVKQKRSRRKKEENQPHVCEVCGNVYNRRHTLEHHLKRHSAVKEFECELCGNAFHSSFELGRHMRKHTGSRPYKCSYCPKAFGDHSTLTKHERVHRNERPFKCDICGACFSYPGVLKRHKLVHTGEKPYKCEICGKCFNDRYHLQSHLKTIQHKDDPRVESLLLNIRENNV